MKSYDSSAHEQYDRGLTHIRALIDGTLVKAGAKMMVGCVSLPPWRNRKRATESITVVPCDAPKMKVEFTIDEIMGSRDGVQSAEVLQKVGRYVSEYARFHQNPDRLALLRGRARASGPRSRRASS